MKKYILYLLTGMAACSFCGCEDALDRFPKDRLTPDEFFHTEEECELYTNDFYTIFPSGASIYNETADIITCNTLTSEVLGNRTVPATASTWKWEKLRDINFFLQYSSNCTDDRVRLEYEGLARFFRAYFYFDKVRYYGDVPWVDRPLASDDQELYKGRDSREFVMQKVIGDLDFAIANLPAERQVYRVTRWTALALKSRACLFEGTFRKYHGLQGWESYLEVCADASKRFIDESGYAIYDSGTTPYLGLFSSLKAINTEIVLARAYNTDIGLKHDVNGYLTSITMGRPGLLKNIANMYLMKDGTPFTSQPGWETMQLPDARRNSDGGHGPLHAFHVAGLVDDVECLDVDVVFGAYLLDDFLLTEQRGLHDTFLVGFVDGFQRMRILAVGYGQPFFTPFSRLVDDFCKMLDHCGVVLLFILPDCTCRWR